jgi:phage tail protein X
MRLTTLQKTETSISALAERIYPNLGDSARKKAEAALAKANPQLAKPGAFRAGVIVNLPDDIKPRPGTASADPVTDTVSGLQDAVTAYHDALIEGIRASIADMVAQEKILKQKEVATAIKANPSAAELAKSLAASLRQRARLAEQEVKAHDATFAEIAKDIESLSGQLRRS